MDPLISPFVSEEEVVKYMQVALEEARKAVNKEEVPVGCVFVRQGSDSREIVARSHNLTNEHQNASRHCQINCLMEMEKRLTPEEISQCVLFVTIEPCVMCTHALNLMGISKVYFGQFNDKFGGCGSLRKDNKFDIQGGILQRQSFQLIRSFYERGNQRLPEQMRNKSRKKVKKNYQ